MRNVVFTTIFSFVVCSVPFAAEAANATGWTPSMFSQHVNQCVQSPPEQLSGTRVRSFSVANQPLYECLWRLAEQTRAVTGAPHILMECLEPIILFVDSRDPMGRSHVESANPYYGAISFGTSEADFLEVVDSLLKLDGNMVWSFDEDTNVVNVIDRRLVGHPEWELNRPVTAGSIRMGDGGECMVRIAEENCIDFRGPRKWNGRISLTSWTGERLANEAIPYQAGDFRQVVNLALSHVAPANLRFSSVEALIPRYFVGGRATEEAALASAAWYRSIPEDGFGKILRDDPNRDYSK